MIVFRTSSKLFIDSLVEHPYLGGASSPRVMSSVDSQYLPSHLIFRNTDSISSVTAINQLTGL